MMTQTYTVTIDEDGNRYWRQNDQRHRVDGPAIEYADGTRYWYQNDQLHRTDGPAIEYADGPAYEGADGDREWYLNGQLHRVDGPACEYADGNCEWWLNGQQLSEAEHCARTQPKTYTGQVIEVDGRKYRLTAL